MDNAQMTKGLDNPKPEDKKLNVIFEEGKFKIEIKNLTPQELALVSAQLDKAALQMLKGAG